ncbi:MAG: hypothetical protein K2X71_20175 [Methylobacterium sp.]|uniref:hypothetical protein n=1 Tax=Methylobacterium sp. TaxID=409 RepID=UPI0025865E19|nr:hypothetical protein [Methylobacterium sp.]MBY0298320.1 hypothetical protein [Methylobacterium sp.]
MIRTATLIVASAALASYVLVGVGQAGPERPAAPQHFTGKRFTDRLPSVPYAPEARDVALYTLGAGPAAPGAARACAPRAAEGACLAAVEAKPAPGVALLARVDAVSAVTVR